MKEPVHYRRCHLCGTMNQCEGDSVERCLECGKVLAPFFYFDERLVAIPSDNHLRPPLLMSEYQPVRGLTVVWDPT